MAISFITSAPVFAPVYNPIYYNVISTNVAQPDFQYVFNLFEGYGTSSNPISTINLFPRPTSNCLYNPARILESIVSADQNIQGITAATSSTTMVNYYTIDVGEYYGGNTYTGLSETIGYVFNGVLQYDQIPSWPVNYSNYIMVNSSGSTNLFLTNQPRSGVLTLLTDTSTLSFAGYVPAYMQLKIHNFGSTNAIVHNIPITANTGSSYITHLPSGPANLNNYSIHSTLITNNTDYYTIALLDINNGIISETITYNMDQSCSKYSNMRIQFLNPYGAWDYVNFRMKSKETVNVTKRTLYKQNLPYNYTVGAREQTQIDFDGYTTYTVTSDWVSDDYSKWFKELMRAQQINIIESNWSSRPVNIVETSDYVQTVLNDSLPQYIFNFNTAYSINAGRS